MTAYAHGLAEIIQMTPLAKVSQYHSPLNYNAVLHRAEKNNPNFHTELQKPQVVRVQRHS